MGKTKTVRSAKRGGKDCFRGKSRGFAGEFLKRIKKSVRTQGITLSRRDLPAEELCKLDWIAMRM